MNEQVAVLQGKRAALPSQEEVDRIDGLLADLMAQIQAQEHKLQQLRAEQESSEMVRASKEIQNLEISE